MVTKRKTAIAAEVPASPKRRDRGVSGRSASPPPQPPPPLAVPCSMPPPPMPPPPRSMPPPPMLAVPRSLPPPLSVGPLLPTPPRPPTLPIALAGAMPPEGYEKVLYEMRENLERIQKLVELTRQRIAFIPPSPNPVSRRDPIKDKLHLSPRRSSRMEMGEADSETILQEDDSKLSVISFDEILPSKFSNDEKLAEELQLQEVLASCIKTYTETSQHSGSHPSCEISERPMRSSTEDAQKVKFFHDPNDPEVKQLIQVFREDPDDPKEKQLTKFPRSKTEIGQSSSALSIEEEYCSICMEAKPLSKFFRIKSCSHKFCTSCVGQYIATKVEENLTSIGCPDPECKDGILEPETCRPIIPIEVFDRWGIALCESLLGSRKFYCPYEDCSTLLVDEGGDEEGSVITDSECPHCNRMFCAQCRVPWHDGIGCKEFQLLGEDERGREDVMLKQLATKSKWQRCPLCRIFVERIDGCKFMNCRCGYCFCYLCAFPMSKDTHFCEKCRS